MLPFRALLVLGWSLLAAGDASPSLDGIRAFAQRRFGSADAFTFKLDAEEERWSRWNAPSNDKYTVSSSGGKILVEGTSINALARG